MKLLGILWLPLVFLLAGCAPKYPLKTTVEWMTDQHDIRPGCPVRYLGGEEGGPAAGEAGVVLEVERQEGRLRIQIGIRDPYAKCVQFATHYSFHPATNGASEFLEIRSLRLGADKLPTKERWLPHGGRNPKVPNLP